MRAPHRAAVAAVALAALATGACGRGHTLAHTVKPHTRPADSAAVKVIRAWSDTLRASHVERAAAYFAVPTVVQFQQGGAVTRLRRRIDTVAFNATLPCGARLVSASRSGRYVNALFVLSDRPGSPCDAPGRTARTNFVVRGGKITEWRRAADRPGDEQHADPVPRGQTV